MDGFDFLRYRNDDPRLAAVPVVLVTNAKPHERPHDRRERRRPQADRHRRNPIRD